MLRPRPFDNKLEIVTFFDVFGQFSLIRFEFKLTRGIN